MAGPHTLAETERTVAERLAGLPIDHQAMAVTSNLFRAANSVRNYMEREVLIPNDLTWTAFVVMWVTWIWGPAETRMIASEAGISKATLSGVLNTLQARGLLTRKKDEQDGRLVVVALTPSGLRLIKRLFPKINAAEQEACRMLSAADQESTADCLRRMVEATGKQDGES
jgi:DNA-binding MarR family transcriptional regulator